MILMTEKIILLISLDKEYVDRIESKLPFMLGEGTRLHIIDNEDYLSEYMNEDHAKIDVLITDENLYQSVRVCQPSDKAFVLSETIGNTDMISKYDAETGIVQKIGSEYLKSGDIPKQKTHVIDVISVSGGCGKTKTALGIAGQFFNMGYKVLYVDAEETQNYNEFIPQSWNVDFANDSLSVAMITRNIGAVLSNIQRARFDVLPAFKNPIYVYNLDLTIYYDIIQQIAEREIYDYIIVEHSSVITKSLIVHLSDSKEIVICMNGQKGSARRIDALVDNLVKFEGECVVVSSGEYGEPCRFPVCETVSYDNDDVDFTVLTSQGKYWDCAMAVR